MPLVTGFQLVIILLYVQVFFFFFELFVQNFEAPPSPCFILTHFEPSCSSGLFVIMRSWSNLNISSCKSGFQDTWQEPTVVKYTFMS